MNTQTYNGWTNYETWCVSLWLNNDQGSYRFWKREAERALNDAPESKQVKEWGDSVAKAACCLLAEQLREALNETDLLETPDMYTDLLRSALDEVNWLEVAAEFLPEEDEHPERQGGNTPTPFDMDVVQSLPPKFPLGTVVSTPNALNVLSQEEITAALIRHERGDWGDVVPEDHEENELSLREGFRLMSVYRSANATKFWIITEADRSVTTVLLPEDY